MEQKKKEYRSFHEHPDGSISVDDSDVHLTVTEFRNLQALMPDIQWWGFVFPRSEDILNDAYVPFPDHALFLENYSKDPAKFLHLDKRNKRVEANQNEYD